MMNNETVAHNFVYGETGKGSSFYSEKANKAENILYSYSSVLALKFGDIVVISERIAHYSNTSQKHKSHLLRALPSYFDVIWVHDLDNYSSLKEICNNEALKRVNNNLTDFYKKQKRARKTDYSYMINREIENGDLILKHGKIDKRKEDFKLFQELKSSEDLEGLIEKSIEAEKKQKAKEAKAKAKRNLERLEKFKGEKLKGFTNAELNECSFLRIDDDIVRTSNSSNVPLKEAKLLYIAYKKGLKLTGQKIGYYTVIKQDKKYLQIGCNKLSFKDIENTLKGAYNVSCIKK